MATNVGFSTKENLKAIVDFIYSDFRNYEAIKSKAIFEQRKELVKYLMRSPEYIEKHKALFQWRKENPHIKLGISDGYFRHELEEALAEKEAEFQITMPNWIFKHTSEGQVAYLRFLMLQNREEAIKATLEKYYSEWPEFVENFKV